MTWTGMRRRPRRLVVGVVVPLALAVAAGGTAAFLMRALANGANAAANTASRMSKDSVSGVHGQSGRSCHRPSGNDRGGRPRRLGGARAARHLGRCRRRELNAGLRPRARGPWGDDHRPGSRRPGSVS